MNYEEFACKIHIYDNHRLDISEVERYIASKPELKPLHFGKNFMKIGKVYKCNSIKNNIYLDDLDSFMDVKLKPLMIYHRMKYNKFKSIPAVINNSRNLSIFNVAAIMNIDCDVFYYTKINRTSVYRLIQYRCKSNRIRISNISSTEFFSA